MSDSFALNVKSVECSINTPNRAGNRPPTLVDCQRVVYECGAWNAACPDGDACCQRVTQQVWPPSYGAAAGGCQLNMPQGAVRVSAQLPACPHHAWARTCSSPDSQQSRLQSFLSAPELSTPLNSSWCRGCASGCSWSTPNTAAGASSPGTPFLPAPSSPSTTARSAQ